MSKKGLSPDEKAAKLLSWFQESKSFFSAKEVEKDGAKHCGISTMIIKDILKLLLDDSLVNQEKIGTSNYFWSYPGASAAKIRAQHQSTKATLDDLTKKHEQAVEALAKVQVERGCGEDDEEARQTLLKSYYDEQAALDSVKAELAKFSSGDPAIYEQKKLDIELMKESALRWTDQISTVISHVRNNGVDPADVRAMLDLPEDYEELTF